MLSSGFTDFIPEGELDTNKVKGEYVDFVPELTLADLIVEEKPKKVRKSKK
jgi:hypothetical protein